MSKKTIIFLMGCSTIFLVGCFGGNNEEAEFVTFGESFGLEIPFGFETINPKLVENKQITNKVLLSYKKKNEGSFDDNIVVTRSEIGPNLDYEQFRTVNSQKLRTSLSGYIPGSQERISLDCGGEEIPGLYVTFDVKNTFSEVQDLTYISQIQFLYQEKGYIASFASINEKDRNKSIKRLKNISCSQPK